MLVCIRPTVFYASCEIQKACIDIINSNIYSRLLNKTKLFIMIILEFILALIQFSLNLLLAICMIPFIPIVWLIREIKGVKPVIGKPYVNLPKVSLKPKNEKTYIEQ